MGQNRFSSKLLVKGTYECNGVNQSNFIEQKKIVIYGPNETKKEKRQSIIFCLI